MAESKGLISLRYIPLGSFAMLTGILTSAFRLRIEPLNPGFKSRDPQHKNKTPAWAFDFCGGVEGIRTLDTVAGIPHFQCGALDQLCDDSGFFDDFNYSCSPASGVSSSSLSATIGSSINAFSNSASISRNSGSVDSTSNDCSAESVIGVSL